MPTQTFLHLDETKKQRIIDQTVFLILNHPISEITISMIVKEASIPRGSFYQYFSSLEDILKYIYDIFIQRFEEFKEIQIAEKQWDIFDFFKDSFYRDYQFFTTSDFHNVYSKLLHEKKFVGLDLAVHESKRMMFIEKMLSQLDTQSIDHLKKEEQIDLYILYLRMKNQEIHRIMAETKTYDEAYQTFLFYLDILRRGTMNA